MVSLLYLIGSNRKRKEMFVIDSYIDIDEECRIPYKVYGIYNSKEQAIKALTKLNAHLQDNYGDNILYAWDFADGFSLQLTYTEPGDEDFEQVAGLFYEVKEISNPDSILSVSPNNIGYIIQKIRNPDSDSYS